MRVAIIYVLVWFLVITMASGAYLSSFVSEVTLPVFGFVFSTLAFLGVVAVLPALMKDCHSANPQRKH